MPVLQFQDVWEMYRIKFAKDGNVSWEDFWALKGITFAVEKGESLGIIGENGAGKSTILKLISGILKPDRGEIAVRGRVSGLLELGAGFQPELTGRDNIYFNAGLFGLEHSRIQERYEDIVDFADIGKFIHAPIKYYSQGMFVRLAFAVAVHMDADILVIDDTLAVGDEYFQRKCVKKIFEIKEQGRTIVFVTHDMHMLNRLCGRTIFLKEGKIISDSLTDKVVPLYVQTVGSRAGVDILEKKPLSLVFNNGRLFINWEDRLLTPNSGAYAFFSVANKRYNSYQADWEVNRESENKIIATGKLYQLKLTQIWILEIVNDYEIKCDMYIELDEPLEIQEGSITIMLSNKYTHWFTTLERGDFPIVDDKVKGWQVLFDSNLSIKCMGVESDSSPNGKIPAVSFEQLDTAGSVSAQILNTDYLANCRILQYKIFGLQDYSERRSDRFIYFSGKIIVNIPQIDRYLEKIDDELILSNKKIQLILNNGHGIIYYNGIKLTKANHMHTSIYINGKWYSSALASWKIKKAAGDLLVATGRWSGLPVAQIWKLQLRDNDSIGWEIALRIESEVDIEQQNASLMFSEAYKRWLTTYYGQGDFPDRFLMGEMAMLQRVIPNGLMGFLTDKEAFPSVFLNLSRELSNHGLVYNSSIYDKARIARVHRAETNTRFMPGEYPCFFIEIAIDKDRKNCLIDASANMIERGSLKFIFVNGCGRIFWDGVELTKELCLYTSVYSQGRWHDSAWCAVWEIEDKDKDKDIIKVSGKWLYLPMLQIWEISFPDERTIEFKVKMEITAETEIERMQANIMLSEDYTQWLADSKGGDFPPFNNDVDDNWHLVWSGGCDGGSIGVSGNIGQSGGCLPPVFLSSQSKDPHCRLNVVNSDIYHNGRVLQSLNPERKNFMPGEYLYYEGKIRIGEF